MRFITALEQDTAASDASFTDDFLPCLVLFGPVDARPVQCWPLNYRWQNKKYKK
jgi:hypothetical protein